jgi:hypothetical protein
MPDIKEIRKMLDYKNSAEHKIRMVKIMLDDVIEKEALEIANCDIKQQSTGNNDSVEDAVIAIMNIKTTEGKLINFNAQVLAVYDALEARELYTHPHQWQGLTEDEIHNVADTIDNIEYACEYIDVIDFARAIEAKLKEKNEK